MILDMDWLDTVGYIKDYGGNRYLDAGHSSFAGHCCLDLLSHPGLLRCYFVV